MPVDYQQRVTVPPPPPGSNSTTAVLKSIGVPVSPGGLRPVARFDLTDLEDCKGASVADWFRVGLIDRVAVWVQQLGDPNGYGTPPGIDLRVTALCSEGAEDAADSTFTFPDFATTGRVVQVEGPAARGWGLAWRINPADASGAKAVQLTVQLVFGFGRAETSRFNVTRGKFSLPAVFP